MDAFHGQLYHKHSRRNKDLNTDNVNSKQLYDIGWPGGGYKNILYPPKKSHPILLLSI